MPVIESSYRAPFFLIGGHLQTILPAFRNVRGVEYRRERFETEDGDFLDLDWSRCGASRLVIISHGLEGNTSRGYVRGMVKALNRANWDALAWNYRGCSGEPNRLLRSYHSGETGDLHRVISFAAGNNTYSEIALIGFSLGGNITLKYLGEKGTALQTFITKAVAFSVPCDLKSSAFKLAEFSNKIYMKYFLRSLHEKVKSKVRMMPDQINDEGFDQIRTFVDFDDRYTAPIHGFRDAFDYFEKCSSRQFLTRISIPALLVNAKNDPFLTELCFPYEEAESHARFVFEAPDEGGHTGFLSHGNRGEYWSETRAVQFLEAKVLSTK